MILITENHSFQYDMENLAEIFFPYEKIKVLGELPEEKDNITVITRACGNEISVEAFVFEKHKMKRQSVFAESDMIHKQQTGCRKEDILKGLCTALARGYLNNLSKGRKIETPILFQGGVAANKGIKAAFEEELQKELIVPKHYDVMGAYGAAVIAYENYLKTKKTSYRGKDFSSCEWESENITCRGCDNNCSVSVLKCNGEIVGEWGSRCGRSFCAVKH